jgi:hypothetical protein
MDDLFFSRDLFTLATRQVNVVASWYGREERAPGACKADWAPVDLSLLLHTPLTIPCMSELEWKVIIFFDY